MTPRWRASPESAQMMSPGNSLALTVRRTGGISGAKMPEQESHRNDRPREAPARSVCGLGPIIRFCCIMLYTSQMANLAPRTQTPGPIPNRRLDRWTLDVPKRLHYSASEPAMSCANINFGMSRREFFGRFGYGLGGTALFGLLQREGLGASPATPQNPFKGILASPHFPAKAKRIIYLFMAGGPSQLDLFDYKPVLNQRNGEDLPASVRMGQRLTGMTGYQATLPMAGSLFKFERHGAGGAWISELMPWTAKMVDQLCFIKSLHTEAINHDPAITFFQTGSELAGRPSMGAWLSYGLGSVNQNLPGFVVLISKDRIDQPLYARLWGSGFLPSIHQGVQFRSGKDPVLYLQNPDGVSSASRRKMLDRLAELNALQYRDLGDPEINSRV